MHWQALARVALLAAHAAAEFVPTHEWQEVPEDVAIPGGLDIRLNMETGEKFAKLPDEQAADAADSGSAAASTYAAGSAGAAEHGGVAVVSSDVDVSKLDLDVLEEMAHDIEHGQTVIQNYYPGLIALYEDTAAPSERRDHAGKVIAVALRANPKAALLLREQEPALFHRLGLDTPTVSPRALSVVANIASTEEGLNAYKRELGSLRERLGEISWTQPSAQKLRGLIEDVAAVRAAQVPAWASALQAALPRVADDRARLVLLRTLVDVFQQKDTFAEVPQQRADKEFFAWLSEEYTRKDNKRSTDTDAYLRYVREVKNKVFGNPKADRVRMADEL